MVQPNQSTHLPANEQRESEEQKKHKNELVYFRQWAEREWNKKIWFNLNRNQEDACRKEVVVCVSVKMSLENGWVKLSLEWSSYNRTDDQNDDWGIIENSSPRGRSAGVLTIEYSTEHSGVDSGRIGDSESVKLSI